MDMHTVPLAIIRVTGAKLTAWANTKRLILTRVVMADMEQAWWYYWLVIHSTIIFWAHTTLWTELHRENYIWVKQNKQDLRELFSVTGSINVIQKKKKCMFLWESWAKAMFGETIGSEHGKVRRPESPELTWGQWQSLKVFCFILSF